jgi:site-specific DNA-methyltransferase (adenine-specific)
LTPYYEQDGITIYHGDCLSVMESQSLGDIAAVITDPPYASGARTEAGKSSSGAMLRGEEWSDKPIVNDQMTTGGFVWLMRHVALALYPQMRDGASLLTFIDWRQWPNMAGALETVNLRIQQMIVWDKNTPGMGNGFRSQHELVLHAAKGVPTIHSRMYGNVFSAKRERPVDHPSPKPLSLLAKMAEVVTAEGDLIVDPFMGAGSTLRMAKDLGRRAIGIEAEERYCEIAAKRLSQGVLALEQPA